MKQLLKSLCLSATILTATALAQTPSPTAPKPPSGAAPPAASQAPATPQTKPAATATATATVLPTSDQIVEKYTAALGGQAAIQKLNSRFSKGTVDLPAMGASGTMEMYQKAPDRMVMTMNFAGFGSVQQGFTGTTGWAKDPMTGLRELSGGELAAMKRGAGFYRDIELRKLYPKMTVTGKEKIGERDVYVVEATPTGEKPEKLYFDTTTGLIARIDAVRDTQQGQTATESYLEDYREVDGVKIPFTTRVSFGGQTIILKFDEVKHNVAVDDAKFAKPAAQ